MTEPRESYERRPDDHLVEPLFAALPEDEVPGEPAAEDARWGILVAVLAAVALAVALILRSI